MLKIKISTEELAIVNLTEKANDWSEEPHNGGCNDEKWIRMIDMHNEHKGSGEKTPDQIVCDALWNTDHTISWSVKTMKSNDSFGFGW